MGKKTGDIIVCICADIDIALEHVKNQDHWPHDFSFVNFSPEWRDVHEGKKSKDAF